MKLHLPKQLFTALLAAITIASPAAFTMFAGQAVAAVTTLTPSNGEYLLENDGLNIAEGDKAVVGTIDGDGNVTSYIELIKFNGKNTYPAHSNGHFFTVLGELDASGGCLGLESGAKMVISGSGSVVADTITLGHTSAAATTYHGHIEMTGGSLTTGTITLNNNHANSISIAGGILEFTDENAISRGSNTNTTISIGGTGESSVTLKATQTAWTLDGSGLTTTPTIGNVTVDAGNAYGITLKNVNLTGVVTNNKTLTLGGAVSLTGSIVNSGQLNIDGSLALTSSSQLDTLGATTVKNGGVLDLSGVNGGVLTVDLFNTVNSSNSLSIEDEAWVKLGGANLSVDFVTDNKTENLNKNLHITGDIRFNGKGYNAGSSYKLVVGEGKKLKVDGITKLESKAYLSVQGGDVELGTLLLGHNEGRNPGGVEMSSGSLTLSKIKFNDSNVSNQQATVNTVQITGGALEFTSESALDRGINVSSTISIGGAGEHSVTLKATKTAWTLDGSGLTAAPTVGNVTIDAGNVYGITLKNVNLVGSIVNNAELALGSGVTVAEGGSATVTGGKVQILNTLASAGTLNLNTDAIYVNETLLVYQTVAGTFKDDYSLDGVTLDEGGENGFQLFSGNTYYLSKNSNVTTTLNKVWRDQNTCYDLVSDDSGLHFTVDSAERADAVYYINSGDVTVDSAVQSLATSYVVQGGNMKMTEGSISRAAITYTSGGITLGSDATLTNLTASSDKTLMGSVTGSGTMEVAVADNWNDTINTSADFTGTVYVVSGSKFTYDSDKLGSTLKLATGVNMQVNNGGRLDDTLVLESGNHEVHVNGTTNFDVTGTISGEGTFDKRGGNSTVYIKGNASVENYRNGVGTTTVQGNAAVINLTAADGAVNVQGGTVTNLKANGGTSTLTGGSVSSLVLAGGTVNVQGGSLTDVNYNGSGGSLTFMQVDSQDTTYTLGTIGSSSSDNYSRHLTVNSGVVVNAVNLHNTWGMGTITVDGALNISEELKFSTGKNNNTTNNKLTGSGSVTTKKLTIGNVGTYNFSNVNLTVGDGGVTMDAATLEITSGTMTFDGKWNGTGGTVNLMGGDIFFNYASGVNVMNVLDIAGDNVSTAQVSLAQDVKLQVKSDMRLAGTAAIKLAKDAELKKGDMAIIGTGNESTVKRLISGNDNVFSHNSDDHVVNNAHVNMTSGSAATLALKLDNTAVTNAGAGELTVSNSNNSITNLAATSGNVKLSADMSVDSISAKAGKQVTVADGKTISMEGGVKIAANGGAATLAAKTDNALVRLEADTSFTIADMALKNTSIKAATVDTKVNLKNIEAENVLLAQGAFTLDATANVGTAADGETHGTLLYSAGLGVAEGSTLTLNLDVTSAVAADQLGVYDITITLSGFGDDFVVTDALLGMVKFDAESWLGKELAGASFSVNTGDASEAAVIAAAANGVPTVTYSAGTGENVGALVITISGLSIPEPTTSALSLLALAALAARRRRK